MRKLLTAILLTLPPAMATSAIAQSEPATQASEQAVPAPEKPPAEARGGVGLAIPVGAVILPTGLQSATASTPCYLLVPAGRAEIENPAGLEPILAQAHERGLRVVIRLLDTEWEPLATWSARLLAFSRTLGDQVVAYQFLGPGADLIPAQDYSFLLKNARVAIRSGGSWAPIVSAPFGAADVAWAEQIFAADAGPYLDALAGRGVADFAAVESVRERLLPRASVWVTDQILPEVGAGAEAVRDYLEAHEAGADVVIFVAPPEASAPEASPPAAPAPDAAPLEAATAGGATPESAARRPTVAPLGEVLSFVRAQFPPELRPATQAVLPFNRDAVVEGGGVPEPRPMTIKVLAFFEAGTRAGIAAYRAIPSAGSATTPEGAAPTPDRVRIVLRSPLAGLDLLDPDRAASRALAVTAAAGTVVELPLRAGYMMLRYRLAASALPVKEQAQVGAVSELTAEEIVAREREMRGVQATRYNHYEANATIRIHYRLAVLNETIDLTTDNRLYYKEGRQDYEQTALYVNGARWRGKSPPYLPYLQPAKVNEVPLDISLDERYRYALEGRQRTDDRECYVLSFEPLDPTQSLYHGRVYIDTSLFTRVRMEAVQTGIVAPLRSNEVVFRYGPVKTPAGDVWLPQTMTGQMSFEVLGYNLAIERGVDYTDYQMDTAEFDDRRTEAYQSGRPLFRDTDEGLSRVLTDKNGQETLAPLNYPRNTLLVMGVNFGDNALPSFPFAGINFFDFNFHNTGTQFNLAWAGPFVDIAWTDPRIVDLGAGRRPWALALQGTFNAIKISDKNATTAGTPEEDRADILAESVLTTLAIPTGSFLRWSLMARLLFQDFFPQTGTSDAFVLPVHNVESTLGGRLEFSRLGWIATGWGEWGFRSRWEPWGLPGQKFSEDDRDFTRLGTELRKAFYYGTYNKLSLGAVGFLGRSLDRFSRFELGDFRSASVRGFNGSGIHFDRGVVAEATYSLPLGHDVRADFGLQQGWIQSVDDFGPGYERVTGTGLSFEFSGPWSTLVSVRASAGLATTIPDKDTSIGDVRVLFYRTFNKWSKKGPTGAAPPRPATPPPMPNAPVPGAPPVLEEEPPPAAPPPAAPAAPPVPPPAPAPPPDTQSPP
jgi:hypothetical protein